ncbi:hypothetical protein GF339_22360 [candidate division KSB3 bacterium]|uniref:Uncharacterized protein n=1 Tax=candidate division KSB3 bacterium TaxID=2044937 RepID=A0A9D5Q8Y9_9BACT|nr:hypothetical protein [candidate division KSB3 bacterium]MBD3327346.1 hypothetical protein [candidate division KSB3 bacterium]
MKQIWWWGVLLGLLLAAASGAPAVTVYFKDGTQMVVDRITRIGHSVCLLVDISRIDTTKTPIEDLAETPQVSQEALALTNVDFAPSADSSEIIATGDVVNNSSYPVRRIQVTAILMDEDDHVLLTIQGYVKPETVLPGQTGSYRLQVKKPAGFWKARVELKADAIQ